MRLENIHNVYFLGIGGIGMSALARWFNANGKVVCGYDKTPTLLTSELEKEGVKITFIDELRTIPPLFMKEDEGTLIIFTPAIPETSVQFNYFTERGTRLYKRSEVLGLITQDYFTIAVAGTHGKTTTSSMISHILKSSGKNVMAFIGGILQNYQSNLIINDVDSTQKPIVVVEADEFDRSFHRLSPNVVVLTTVDPDHLDIYDNPEEFEKGFKQFLEKIPSDGKLFVNECVEKRIYKGLTVNTSVYGNGEKCDVLFEINASLVGKELFTISKQEKYELGISGIHNVHNAVGAVCASKAIGLHREEITKGLQTYCGVKRRFEYIVNRKDVVYIDDYAHHPTEIASLVSSVRKIYPDKKITALFQPHLFSRTKDFMDAFAKELSKVDELILLDIYPARELPMEGVTSDVLFSKINLQSKQRANLETAMAVLAKNEVEVVLTIGAGNIDLLIPEIKNYLELDQLIA